MDQQARPGRRHGSVPCACARVRIQANKSCGVLLDAVGVGWSVSKGWGARSMGPTNTCQGFARGSHPCCLVMNMRNYGELNVGVRSEEVEG